ncbi:MAG TPA: M67 family metallopeptidase [Vicinamibacterales bacterium]
MAAGVIDALIRHAREDATFECCGLLIGAGLAVAEAVRARNIASDPATRFTVEPGDHIKARRAARASGLEVIGFYHSHPRTAAMPSETDIAENSYPGVIHAIVSLAAAVPVVEMFRFSATGYEKLQVLRSSD